jgi:hypothetical protein
MNLSAGRVLNLVVQDFALEGAPFCHGQGAQVALLSDFDMILGQFDYRATGTLFA